ncbi:microtubule organization protein AKNA-like [Hippoglossus hippoglossus]|uniref:microtubule organization protein AKNA-like n=1 Tax=Hippoglossus hippoglossus TaxID=8267 RepID=UPI00148C36BF|nr:microtubule organization protein AKNA-like [Hippoglossus hippoglossus]
MDYHFTAEELAAASGIEDETFPEMGSIESPPESYSSPISLWSSPPPQKSEEQEVKWPHTASVFPEVTRVYDGPLNGSVESDTRPEASHSGICTLSVAEFLESRPSPDRELRTAEVNESRIVPLTYPTPDFSNVKPKVRLPKGDYKPPVSRGSSRRESLSFDTTYMSPADIVREVLLNTTDGSSDPSAPNSNGPQDFRSRQEAITLVEQLQEDHNRLLVEHAEANNTIDVLHLKAQMQSRLSHDTSKDMTLDFPRAQRAEMNSGSLHPDGHRAPPSPYLGEQLAKILDIQTDEFLQQLQIYEDLLKRKQLKPSEQMKGLSQLNEGLDSLERGFLFARDEHKLLHQRGEVAGYFDQQRELGGLIFQCGMRMDELKEQVEQMRQDQPTCEAPPSPPPHPTPPSAPSEDGRWSLPQSPHVPLLVDPGRAAELEVSPESDDEETDDEETLNSLYFKPLTVKHRRAEQDFAALTDHYRSFQELPRTFEYNLREAERERFHSSSLSSLGETPASERRNSKLQPGSSRTLSQQDGVISPETDSGFFGSESCHLTPAAGPSPLHQGASQSDLVHQDGNTRKPQTVSASSPPSSPTHRLTGAESRGASWALSPEWTSRGRQRRRSSSCSPQCWVSQTERTRAGSGARLESDSSESRTVSEDGHSDQSSTTAPRHHWKSPRALGPRLVADHDLVHQDENTRKPQAVSASSPPSSPIHRLTGAESRGASWALSPEQTSRGRQRRRNSSCSPQRWVSQAERTRADSGARLESDSSESRTVSEDGHSDQSSTTAPRHHGNSPRALFSNAPRTLEAQVPRLEETVHVQSNETHHSPAGGSSESTPSSSSGSCHCPLCGCLQPNRGTKTDCDRDSAPRTSGQSAESPDRMGRRGYHAAPELPQCMLVRSPLLMSSLPIHVSPSNSPGTSSGVRGHKVARGRMRRSRSVDGQSSQDVSLNIFLDKAIRVAQHMKRTTRHMARSLSAGIQFQERRTQSTLQTLLTRLGSAAETRAE